MTKSSQFANKATQNLSPYSSARNEGALSTNTIGLDANEASSQWLTLPEEVFDVEYNRYPTTGVEEISKKLCEAPQAQGFKPENIYLGIGSSGIIEKLIVAFVNDDETVLIKDPTFPMYEVFANQYGKKLKKFSYKPDFSIDVGAFIHEASQAKLVFICSPNNPSGSILPKDQIEHIVRRCPDTLFAIDEAYIELQGYDQSNIDLLNELDNLIILRTFSKAWGLASVRLGYAIGPEGVIKDLKKVTPPYHIPTVCENIILFALDRQYELGIAIEETIIERDLLEDFFTAKNIKFIKSYTNFVTVKFDGSKNAEDVYNHLKENGILVRNVSKATLLADHLRITIGSQEENQKLMKLLDSYL